MIFVYVLMCSFNPDGKDIVIRRDITRDSSQWQVNGRRSNTKAVSELVLLYITNSILTKATILPSKCWCTTVLVVNA